jgi:RES domain-containing protein
VSQRPAFDLLQLLERFESRVWEGTAWRHMFGDNPPTRQNQLGARWNPPGLPAIYCSLDRDTALAEGDYAVAAQPLRPTVKRMIYKLHVRLEKVLDLSSQSVLRELGIAEPELADVDHAACQRVGGAVEWLEHDGLLVPSARSSGVNLVIFTRKQGAQADFEIIDGELIE